MQMDTRVPLMGQAANPLQAYTQGVSARDAVEEMSRQNALQAFLQNNGQALYAGDQNAIQEFANYDLAGAMGLQQEFEARRQRAAAASAGAGRARQQSEAEALQRAFDVMEVAHGQGEEAFNAALDSYGYRDEAEQYGINFENFGQAASVARAHLGFEQPAVPEGVANVQNNRAAWEAAGFDLNDPRFREFALTGEMPSAPEAPDQPSSVREFEYLASTLGLVPGTQEYNDLATSTLGASAGTVVNVNMPDQTAFSETAGENIADQMTAISTAGSAANRNLVLIDQLGEAAQGAETGLLAQVQLALGDMGINTSGLSELQSMQALINRLVPEQRAPGSGPMSDADLELFKQSLPRLINQPGGNEQILAGMRAIANYEAELGRIADAALYGEITPQEARTQMRALSNPIPGGRVGAPSSSPEVAPSNISVGSPDATARPTIGGNLTTMTPEQLSTIGTETLNSIPAGQLRTILETMTPEQRQALRRRILALSEGN